MLKIRVMGRKYIVVERDGNSEHPVPNWKRHQEAAKTAVCQELGVFPPPVTGLYDCPGWLVSVVQSCR
jgi:hypothetical protein